MAPSTSRPSANYSLLRIQDLARDGAEGPAKFDVYGALGIASGREGRRVWSEAGADFATTLGFLEGAPPRAKRVRLVGGLELPRLLAAVLRRDVALAALREPSLLERICAVHPRADAEAAVAAALAPLEAEIAAGAGALQKLQGLFGRETAIIRYRRVEARDGTTDFLFSAIDLAMAAKGCDYEAAKKLVQRLAEDYFGERLGDTDDCPENGTFCPIFQTIIFEGQRGKPSPCLAVDKAVEFLMVIPGSDLSAVIRREAAETLLRVAGGDASLIATIERNSRLQDFLRTHDPDHPLRAAGNFAERRRREDDDVDRDERLAKIFRGELASVNAQLAAAVVALERRVQTIDERFAALPSLMPVPAHVSVNASARSTAQLARATVRPPTTPAERRALAEGTLLVSAYLRESIAAEHPRLSVAKRRGLLGAIKTAFSVTLENLLLQRGGSPPRVAQMARSQPHYTVDDRPLLDEAWRVTAPFRRDRLRRLARRR
jgi:hypothetical protein